MRSMSAASLAGAIIVVAPLSAAHAQSSVTMYGLLDAGMTYVSNVSGHSLIRENSDGSAPSRLGFRGVENVGGGTSVLFVLEMRPQVSTGTILSPFWDRASFVGISNDKLGTVTIGRQFDFFLASLPLDATSIIEGGLEAGYQQFTGTKGSTAPAVDNHSGTGLYDNSIKYENTIGAWSGGVMYSFGETPNHDSMGSAYVRYAIGNLQLGAGWTKDNFSTTIANEVFAVRALYTMGSWTFLANYSQGRETVVEGSKAVARPLEVAVNYRIGPAISIGAGFGWAHDTNRAGTTATITQPFIGARYFLSKRTALYAIAARNHSSNPSAIPSTVGIPGGATAPSSSASQTVVRLGMQTRF
ncbi:hypothetical protein R20943_02258 [Paraburkholderia aspalathi]|nr:hypothetical protein R20943_02258 [Paraburkholderia aspalathi]